MAESREMKLLLSIDDKLTKQLNSVNKSTESLGSSFKKLGGAILGFLSVNAIKNFAQESVNMAMDNIFAQERLITLLNNSTGATNEQIEVLFRQAEALEAVGVISKENIMTAQGTLATFDLQVETIENLIPKLLDYTVAEKGLNATTQDMTSVANGFGKALQGQTKLLTDIGFKLTDAEKSMLENGTEVERLDTLNQILGKTYDGLNEKIGNTFVGRMKQAQFRMENLKESVGTALIPTLDMLLDSVLDNENGFNLSNESTQRLSRGLYTTANVFKGLGLVIVGIIKVVYYFVRVLGETLSLILSFTYDVGRAFLNMGKIVREVFSAIVMAMTGDFSGAKDKLVGLLNSTFSTTKRTMTGTASLVNEAMGEMSKSFGSAGEAFKEAFVGMNYKEVEIGAGSVSKLNNQIDNASDTAKEAKEKVKDLTKEYNDFNDTVSDTLKSVKSEHEKNLFSIRKEIDDTKNKISELQADYAETIQKETRTVAEEVVKTEQKIADMREQIAKETDEEKRALLYQELEKEENALNANADFIRSIENEVSEARRIAGLTDLERAVEEFNQRKLLAETEFNEKMARLNAELIELKKKERQEIELYEIKTASIEAMRMLAFENYKKIEQAQFNITKEKIEAEIKLYQELAKAMAEVKGGSYADLSGFAKTVSGTEMGGAINVNVYGDVSGKELVEKVSEGIMTKLRLNQRLSF